MHALKMLHRLLGFNVMRPGSLTRQYKDPKSQTGAYYQLSYTLDMRSRTEYIRKEWGSDIRHQIKSTSVTSNSTLSGCV
jgi:hypothetical protein